MHVYEGVAAMDGCDHIPDIVDAPQLLATEHGTHDTLEMKFLKFVKGQDAEIWPRSESLLQSLASCGAVPKNDELSKATVQPILDTCKTHFRDVLEGVIDVDVSDDNLEYVA